MGVANDTLTYRQMASTTLQLFIGQTGSELARGARVVISIHKLLRIQERMKGTGSEVKRGARVVKAYTSSSEVRNLFSEDRG